MIKHLILLLLPNLTPCARILGVFPAPGFSQYILGEHLMTELAKNHHEVTVISPFRPKHNLTNYKTISTESLLEWYKEIDLFKAENLHLISNLMRTPKMGLRLTQHTLAEPEVQKLIHSNVEFDLVIVEQFFAEALLGFAKHFDAPLVIFSSIGPSEWNNHLMGVKYLPSTMPNSRLNYTTRMDFFERFVNTFTFIFELLHKEFIMFPQHDYLLKKYFPNSMNLKDVVYNASLMLLNSHHSITEVLPTVPGMVEIGGFYIKPKPLPDDLQKFLDSAVDGAIYFSMGTNLKMDNIEKNKLHAILTVFSKLKLKVLWKFDGILSNTPPNVYISKWMPQQDILAHPNVKIFISHGGLLSTIETIYFGVPIIGIPIFGDQRMNIAKAVKCGYALAIPYRELSEERLSWSIDEILKNSTYRDNVKQRSQIYHDQPIKPLELALYWVDYVIRYKGAPHLRYVGGDLKWYQYYLLDIFACCIVLMTGFVISISCVLKIFKTINRKKMKTQ